jgi:anti-sigma regulatory factor (Ser/Thr protein kinase)
LANVLADVEPMLHSQVEDSYALRYVLDEMVRNVLEHAASPSHAVVCAQYYPRTRRLALGVADTGVGVRATIRRSHNAPTDHSALQLALRPGVTGTTSHVGGNDMNAGAGLFFTKALAHVSRHNFVLYSGESLFKLLKTDESERDRIPLDPEDDHATWHDSLPSWPGTLVGIDIGLTAGRPFDTILQFINSQYGIDVRRQQHARYKRRPRFE